MVIAERPRRVFVSLSEEDLEAQEKHTHTQTHARMHARARTHAHVRTRAHTHTQIHARTSTHSNIREILHFAGSLQSRKY